MSNVKMPIFHETMIPILDVLKNGETLHTTKLKEKVRDTHYSHLPEELLRTKVKSGDNKLINRIGWGKSYLKVGGYIDQVSRGYVRINEKGLKALEKGELSLQELKSQPEYIKHRKEVETKKQESNTPEINEDSTPQELIETGISIFEEQTKVDLLEQIRNVDPYYFEKIILVLLERMGYGEFIETPKSGDGGIDGIINEDELGLAKIYIQAKRYSENKVREKDIRNFIGAMSGDTDKGIFVTTSTFDEGAIQKAAQARHTIVLIDGPKVVDLMFKFGGGPQTTTTYEIKTIDDDFFENE